MEDSVTPEMYYYWVGVESVVQRVLDDLLDQADRARNEALYFDLRQLAIMQGTIATLRALIPTLPGEAFERLRTYLVSLVDDYDGMVNDIQRDAFAGVVSEGVSGLESGKLLKIERQRLHERMKAEYGDTE